MNLGYQIGGGIGTYSDYPINYPNYKSLAVIQGLKCGNIRGYLRLGREGFFDIHKGLRRID